MTAGGFTPPAAAALTSYATGSRTSLRRGRHGAGPANHRRPRPRRRRRPTRVLLDDAGRTVDSVVPGRHQAGLAHRPYRPETKTVRS